MSTTSTVTTGTLRDTDIDAALGAIAAAMRDDPGFSAIVPDPEPRGRVLRTLLGMLIRDSHRQGNVWVVRDGSRPVGVAVWYAPGDYPPGTWRSLRLMPSMLPLARFGLDTVRRLMQMNENAETHLPDTPCWYLAALGVEPGHQGEGVGSELMRAVLTQIDQRHEPAYLETDREANVRFYERFGFGVRETDVTIAPAGPPYWTMWRPVQ